MSNKKVVLFQFSPFISRWLLLALALTLLAVWSPIAADAAVGQATAFSCRAFPNEQREVIQYGFIHSTNLHGELVLVNGMSVELERTRPDLLTYKMKRGAKLITQGTIKGTTTQFAMTAGGPWGAELHCTTARE